VLIMHAKTRRSTLHIQANKRQQIKHGLGKFIKYNNPRCHVASAFVSYLA